MKIKPLFIFIIFSMLIGCGSNSDSPSITIPPAQGARVLGLHVNNTVTTDYATAYGQAMALGVREVSVSLDWATLEPTVNTYDDTIPDTMDAFYPNYPGDITMVLRPLDTPGASMPSDLGTLPFNDPQVITAFENFLDHLHSRLSVLNASGKIKWIQVGNEIDATLGSDPAKWAQWQAFFNAAKTKIHALWGNSVVVSSIIQFNALKDAGTLAQYLNFLPSLDSATLTYYPLNADFTVRPTSDIASDFDLMANSIPGKPIILQECGYPSSTVDNSSEAQQANFISAVFKAWDTHLDRIALIDFAWQYDVTDAQASQWVIDYHQNGQPYENEFKQYLLTLGLSHYDSTEKPALQRLRDELKARVWTQ